VRLAGLQQGVATHMAARRPERGGGKPCSGEGSALASKLTTAWASMSHGDT